MKLLTINWVANKVLRWTRIPLCSFARFLAAPLASNNGCIKQKDKNEGPNKTIWIQ